MKKINYLLLTVAMTAALNSHALAPERLTKDVFITLWAGTPVSLELIEDLSSRDITAGQSVRLIVRSNVVVNGKVLIAAGMSAEGYISEKKRKCDRDCTEIKIVMETVQTVDGQRVFLMDIARKALLDCCRGDATLSAGTVFSAKIRNDVQVQA